MAPKNIKYEGNLDSKNPAIKISENCNIPSVVETKNTEFINQMRQVSNDISEIRIFLRQSSIKRKICIENIVNEAAMLMP